MSLFLAILAWLAAPFGAPGTSVSHYEVSVPVPPAHSNAALPRIYGDDDTRPLVVIDPGHGGADPGAIAPGGDLREKDLTLRIAQAIKARLLATGRVRVALTREDDRFLVLDERYGLARRLHGDLFISIHCDSVELGEGGDRAGASGASVYTLSEVASDKEAARLAARENRADAVAGLDRNNGDAQVQSILIDLTQRDTMAASAVFAGLLGRETQGRIPTRNGFHRMASLVVLKAPDLPSVLLETGYISSPADAALLASPSGQARVADAVSRAVEVYFARRGNRAT